ncbi:ribonuclease HII [Eggerthellaceae bacterium zg-893]|nr:ribonuclease HII [Eggerthellaceae bacterium zg-893]
MELTVARIVQLLNEADEETFAVLERSLEADGRKGVRRAVAQARRRLDRQAAEQARLDGLYAFERELTGRPDAVVVGLDEAGRGPLAGPLAVGAVVLGQERIEGLNDSKQVKEADRPRLAQAVREKALACHVEFVEPAVIDEVGMARALRLAFSRALAAVEATGVAADVVLVDGNPLHIDPREVNVVKGDARCAAIAAASIVAKVARDALMVEYDKEYPGYGFAQNKGYGSAGHLRAIDELGLTPIHRASFCTRIEQPSLF